MFQSFLCGMISAEQRKDYLRQAEMDRLASLATPAQPSASLDPLAILGRALIAGDNFLRARSGDGAIRAPTLTRHAR